MERWRESRGYHQDRGWHQNAGPFPDRDRYRYEGWHQERGWPQDRDWHHGRSWPQDRDWHHERGWLQEGGSYRPVSGPTWPTPASARPASASAWSASASAQSTSASAWPASTSAWPKSAAAWPASPSARPASPSAQPASTSAPPVSASTCIGGPHQETKRPLKKMMKIEKQVMDKKTGILPPKGRRIIDVALPKGLSKKSRSRKKKKIIKEFVKHSQVGDLEKAGELIKTHNLSRNVITKGLFQAVKTGDLKGVQMFMKYPQSKKYGWNGGLVLIREALEKNHIEIAKMLLRAGVNVMNKNKAVDSVLYTAMKTGDLQLVEMVIQNDVESVNWPNSKKQTALHDAVEACNEHMVQLLLKYKAVPIKDKKQFEPLHLACLKRLPRIVEILLNHRLESASHPDSLNIALLIATERGDERIVLTLLNAGADPNFCLADDLRNDLYSFHISSGTTPLLLAQKNNLQSIQDILLTHGPQLHGSM